MKHSLLAVAGVVGFTFFLTAQAGSQAPGAPPRYTAPLADSALEAQTSAVAATLRCPVCQGESIQESPSALAQQMRKVVRDRLRAGQTPDQVRAYFVSRYGEWILLEPRMTGFNIVLYALPVVLVVGGIALVVVLVRRWTRQAGATVEESPIVQGPETVPERKR